MDKQRSEGERAVLAVSGMTCSGCANAVTRALSRVPGVTGVQVDLETGRAVVGGTARPQDLVAAVEAAGYGVQIRESDAG